MVKVGKYWAWMVFTNGDDKGPSKWDNLPEGLTCRGLSC